MTFLPTILFFFSGVASQAGMLQLMEVTGAPYQQEYDAISFDEATERARVLRREEGTDGEEHRDFLAYCDTKIPTAMVVHDRGRSLFPAGALEDNDAQPDIDDPRLLLWADMSLGPSEFTPVRNQGWICILRDFKFNMRILQPPKPT